MENENITDELTNDEVSLLALAINIILEDEEPFICERNDFNEWSPVKISLYVKKSLIYFEEEDQIELNSIVNKLRNTIEGETHETETENDDGSCSIPVQDTLI